MFNSKEEKAKLEKLIKEVNELQAEKTELTTRIKMLEEAQNAMANDLLVLIGKVNLLEEKAKPKYFG